VKRSKSRKTHKLRKNNNQVQGRGPWFVVRIYIYIYIHIGVRNIIVGAYATRRKMMSTRVKCRNIIIIIIICATGFSALRLTLSHSSSLVVFRIRHVASSEMYSTLASTTRRSKKRTKTCFYDVFGCTIIYYYNNIYLYISIYICYIISEYIYIFFNFFFTGPGIPFSRRVQALNLAWIIVGETYDVASSHAFRTKLLDKRQAPRTSIGGRGTGAHQLPD